jgi:hypothetical protein
MPCPCRYANQAEDPIAEPFDVSRLLPKAFAPQPAGRRSAESGDEPLVDNFRCVAGRRAMPHDVPTAHNMFNESA